MKNLFASLAADPRFSDLQITQNALETQRVIAGLLPDGRELVRELRAIRRRDFAHCLEAQP